MAKRRLRELLARRRRVRRRRVVVGRRLARQQRARHPAQVEIAEQRARARLQVPAAAARRAGGAADVGAARERRLLVGGDGLRLRRAVAARRREERGAGAARLRPQPLGVAVGDARLAVGGGLGGGRRRLLLLDHLLEPRHELPPLADGRAAAPPQLVADLGEQQLVRLARREQLIGLADLDRERRPLGERLLALDERERAPVDERGAAAQFLADEAVGRLDEAGAADDVAEGLSHASATDRRVHGDPQVRLLGARADGSGRAPTARSPSPRRQRARPRRPSRPSTPRRARPGGRSAPAARRSRRRSTASPTADQMPDANSPGRRFPDFRRRLARTPSLCVWAARRGAQARAARARRSRAAVTAARAAGKDTRPDSSSRPRPHELSSSAHTQPSSAMYKLCLLALVASATGAPPAATAAAAAAPRRAGSASRCARAPRAPALYRAPRQPWLPAPRARPRAQNCVPIA